MSSSEPLLYRPPVLSTGGTVIGVHYLMDWSCPYYWYNRYLRPHPDGQGLQPRATASPLLLGGIFHSAQEAYYRSGYLDGQYDLEAGLSALRAAAALRRDDWEDLDTWQADQALAEEIMRRYHSWYGPGGHSWEWPHFRVLVDAAGEPLIEPAYEIDLGYLGYRLSCRFDALVEWHGNLYVREIKTTSGSFGTLFQQYTLHAQPLAELTVARAVVPYSIQGVLIDACAKKYTSRYKTPPFSRHCISRSEFSMEKFRVDTISTLIEIDEHVGRYQDAIQGGMPEPLAGMQVFGMKGQFNGKCYAFGRHCEYTSLCHAPEHQDSLLTAFKARVKNTTQAPNPSKEEDLP